MAQPSAFSPFFWQSEMASLFARTARMWIATGETASASAEVVGARMPIIEAAMNNPFAANLPELSLMSSEKLSAFSASQTAYWSAFGSVAQLMQAQWMDMIGLTMKGQGLGMTDVSRLNNRSVAIAKSAMGAGEKSLKPYHSTTKANAKRLRK